MPENKNLIGSDADPKNGEETKEEENGINNLKI